MLLGMYLLGIYLLGIQFLFNDLINISFLSIFLYDINNELNNIF